MKKRYAKNAVATALLQQYISRIMVTFQQVTDLNPPPAAPQGHLQNAKPKPGIIGNLSFCFLSN